MTNYKKNTIAQGFVFFGIGTMVIGYFVMCAEILLSGMDGLLKWPVIGISMMIGGVSVLIGSLLYQTIKGWL